MRFDVAKKISQTSSCCRNSKKWVIEDFQEDIPVIFGCSTCGFSEFLIDDVLSQTDNRLTRATLTNGFSTSIKDWLSKWISKDYFIRFQKLNEIEYQVIACYQIIKMYLLDQEDSFTQAPDWDDGEFLQHLWPEFFYPVIDVQDLGRAYIKIDNNYITISSVDGEWELFGNLERRDD